MDWKKYIKDNCRRTLLLGDLADEFGISAETLRYRIRRETGTPFKQLYLSAKMTEAARLIRSRPYDTMDNIAEAVGLEDPFYFSRLFRKYRGVTPSEYRRTSW